MKSLRRLALYIFFFSINFEVWDPLGTNGLFSIAKLTGYVYLITMLPELFSFITKKENRQFINPLILFFTILTIVNLFSIDANLGNFFHLTIFQNIVVMYILINHEQEDPCILEKGMLSFALGSLVLAVLYNMGIGVEISENGQVKIFEDNQNSIGLRSSVASIILIHNILINPLKIGYSRFLLLIPLLLIFELLAVSASRSAALAFVTAFIAGGFLIKTGKTWIKFLIMIFTIGFLIVAINLLLQHEVFRMRVMATIWEGDLSGRDIIWHNIFPLILDKPILGAGTVGYETYSFMVFGELKSPHNVFLEILCYTGIIGLAIYMLFLYRIFMRSYRLFRQKKLILPLLLLIPVVAALTSGQILNVKIGWLIFAYIAGTSPDITGRQNCADIPHGHLSIRT
ncbi:MAG TPA: O-antigen ligase family protein [Bacteroidales bacterium]|nr:O-antigen ligase family protein [Bacteroidales bacterium]